MRFRSPWPKWKTLTSAPLLQTGDKGAPLLPQTLDMRKQLQRKTEAPSLAPPQTQLSTGDVINVSKQDEQGNKFALTACRIEDIKETPRACFRDLQYPLWVINADLFVEYDSAGFVPKWLFDVMMLGKDVIFYGKADVVQVLAATCRGCGVWRRKRIQPQCHSTMPGCRYTLGYRVPSAAICISPTSTVCGSEQRVAGISRYICFFRRLRCRCVREASRTAAFIICPYSSHLQLPKYVTYSAGHFEEMQNRNLGGFMPLIHVLWFLNKYLLDSGHADAVVVFHDTPAMAAKIPCQTSRKGLKWGFWLCQRSSKRTLRMPLEVLCSMRSSCGTC